MRYTGTLLFLIFSFLAFGQQQSVYQRVKIHFDGKSTSDLARTGIDVMHGQKAAERFFITDLSLWELDAVRKAGFRTDILIEDVQQHYVQQMTRSPEEIDCILEKFKYRIPEYFTLGTMGGFHTFEEMKNTLDDMSIMFPHLITIKQRIGPETQEGNSIYWLKISDNPDTNEDEPEVLYTALHHAREPISLSQMLYFMWHLLEQYGKDPEITFLIDNTELYFIPCVNPDGYEYNSTQFPTGGGMWRKNLRDNDDNGIFDEQEDGVDINRNYGHEWAHDDEGSSGSVGSSVYRGPEAFSEPETQAVRELLASHNFQFVINYHSFGNSLLYPWGYINAENPQATEFFGFSELLTKENRYDWGNTYQTLGYYANGTAVDWQYSEQSAYSFTPEVGSEDQGFWPSTENIIPLCQSSLHQNITLAQLPHNYAFLEERSEDYVQLPSGTLDLGVKRYGLKQGSFLLEVNPIGTLADLEFAPQLLDLQQFEERGYVIPYSIDPSVREGDEIAFEIRLNNGTWTRVDTIVKTVASKTLALQDQGLTMQEWNQEPGSTWGVTLEESYSEPASLTDSPNGEYSENQVNIMSLKTPIDLTKATHAELRYKAKWEIEELIDYAAVQVSTNGVDFVNLCGNYTHPGSVFQLYLEPLYDGVQEEWIQEVISLDAYLGSELYLQYLMVSDGFFNLDGIYIDDIEIVLYDENTTSAISLEPANFEMRYHPNPAHDALNIRFDANSDSAGNLEMYISNSLGQSMDRFPVAQGADRRIDLSSYAPGWYAITLLSEGKMVGSYRFLVQ